MAASWLQADPYRGTLTDPETLSRYGYVGDNPATDTDAFGYIKQQRMPTITPAKSMGPAPSKGVSTRPPKAPAPGSDGTTSTLRHGPPPTTWNPPGCGMSYNPCGVPIPPGYGTNRALGGSPQSCYRMSVGTDPQTVAFNQACARILMEEAVMTQGEQWQKDLYTVWRPWSDLTEASAPLLVSLLGSTSGFSVKSTQVPKTATTNASPALNWGQQSKHFPGHPNYIPGRSQVTSNPEVLIQRAGTGQPSEASREGSPDSRSESISGRQSEPTSRRMELAFQHQSAYFTTVLTAASISCLGGLGERPSQQLSPGNFPVVPASALGHGHALAASRCRED